MNTTLSFSIPATIATILGCAALIAYLAYLDYKYTRQSEFEYEFKEWSRGQSKIRLVRFEGTKAIVRLTHRNYELAEVIKLHNKWVIKR